MSILEGIGQFGLSFGNAMMKREAEQKAEAVAAEQKAYERQRQATQDKQAAEKHELDMKAGGLEFEDKSNDFKLKKRAQTYGQSYATAKGMFESGNTDGALDYMINTTNNDTDSPYTVAIEKNPDGTVKYRDDGKGNRTVYVSTIDKATGKPLGGYLASPQQVLAGHGMMAAPETIVKNDLEIQKKQAESGIDVETYSRKSKIDVRDKKDYATFEDGIDDGNAQRDHVYKKDEAKFGSGLRMAEDDHETTNIIKRENNSPTGRLTLATMPYVIQQKKADAKQADADATTAQYTADYVTGRGTPNNGMSANGARPMTAKELIKYNKKMTAMPMAVSANMGKNTNKVAGMLAKDLGADQIKARTAINKFSVAMNKAMTEPDETKALQYLQQALTPLSEVIPRNKFKSDEDRTTYVKAIAGQLAGYGQFGDFVQDVDKYRTFAGKQTVVSASQKKGAAKPTLTPPNSKVTTVVNPMNNNTPYNGVQANYAPVPGADMKTVNDVLK
jgi:hypothetical protein